MAPSERRVGLLKSLEGERAVWQRERVTKKGLALFPLWADPQTFPVFIVFRKFRLQTLRAGELWSIELYRSNPGGQWTDRYGMRETA